MRGSGSAQTTVLATTLAVLVWALGGCYVTRQALHQNDLFNTRRPVAAVIADPETPEKTRTALVTVQRILQYAAAQGLNASGAYRYYIDTREPVVSYIVQAAYPDRLEYVMHWFPVIGSVPYLGFFKKEERDVRSAALRAEGYDVYDTGAGAFSSLGWFDDPVFSSMLARNEADLAHLFFHELTHRTLWVPGSTDFNENLAEYVAMQITPRYLQDTGRADLVPRYQDKRADRRLFRTWLEALRDALEAVYAQRDHLPNQGLLQAKAAVFRRFTQAPDKPKFKVVDWVDGETWNNASVLGASLYAPDEARFGAAFACTADRSVRGFLAALKQASGEAADPFDALDHLCAGRSAVPSSGPKK